MTTPLSCSVTTRRLAAARSSATSFSRRLRRAARPGPPSRYAASSSPPSGRFGQGAGSERHLRSFLPACDGEAALVGRSVEQAARNEQAFRVANEGLEQKAAEFGFGEARTPY